MRILLARFGWFGDVILVLPIVDALAKDSRVRALDVLTTTEYAAIFDADPRIRRVMALDRGDPDRVVGELARHDYDVFVDLHSSPGDAATELARTQVRASCRIGFAHAPRPELTHAIPPRKAGEHAIACYLRALTPIGVAAAGAGGMVLRDKEIQAARHLLDPARPNVCLLPGSRLPWRRWPAERFAELARDLRRAGCQPVIAGHGYDRAVVDQVVAVSGGATPYVTDDTRALAAVFGAAGVAVGNNSGLLHLAAAAGAHVVCLQSHLDADMWIPWGTGHVMVAGPESTEDCGCVVNEQGDLGLPCGATIATAAVLDAIGRVGASTCRT